MNSYNLQRFMMAPSIRQVEKLMDHITHMGSIFESLLDKWRRCKRISYCVCMVDADKKEYNDARRMGYACSANTILHSIWELGDSRMQRLLNEPSSVYKRLQKSAAWINIVERPKIVGKVKKYTLMKFAINNGSGIRVQCIAWEGQVERTAKAVQLNKIIYLDGAQAKQLANVNFNIGTMPYELIINSNTIISDLGSYGLAVNEVIPEISLADVAGTSGKIKVSGYMKTLISLAENQQGTSSQGIGAITDGTLTLEVHTTSMNKMPQLEKRQPVEIVGTINHGKVIYLKVSDGECIVAVPGEKLTHAQMMSITKIPAKRAKLDDDAS